MQMAADSFETQLLVDEEGEDSQKDNKDPYGGQEANGFRSDWQEKTQVEGKKKVITITMTQLLILTTEQIQSSNSPE